MSAGSVVASPKPTTAQEITTTAGMKARHVTIAGPLAAHLPWRSSRAASGMPPVFLENLVRIDKIYVSAIDKIH